MEKPPICNYEGSDYQRSFWEQGGRAYEDAAEEVALQRLLPTSGRFLLELGAGAGRNTPRYKGFKRVALLDYSRTQLEQAQQRLGNSGRYLYVAADIYRLPFAPDLFDAATMIRTLHHMAEPRRALEQVRQVLQPGAAFILEFANKKNLKAILRYGLRRQSWNPFSPEPIEFAPLNFDFHPATVRAWLKLSGFALERQLTVSHFRIGLLKQILPLGVLVWMEAQAQWRRQLVAVDPQRLRALAGVGPGSGGRAGGPLPLPGLRPFSLPDTAAHITCPHAARITRWKTASTIFALRLIPIQPAALANRP